MRGGDARRAGISGVKIVTEEKHVEGGIRMVRGGIREVRARVIRRRPTHVAAVGVKVLGDVGLRLLGEGEMREEMVGGCRVRRGSSWVDEIGASFEATHGSGGAVVGAGGFLRRVEGAEPTPLLGLGIPYLRRIAAPRPAPDSSVPHCTAGATVFSGGALVSDCGSSDGWALFGVV